MPNDSHAVMEELERTSSEVEEHKEAGRGLSESLLAESGIIAGIPYSVLSLLRNPLDYISLFNAPPLCTGTDGTYQLSGRRSSDRENHLIQVETVVLPAYRSICWSNCPPWTLAFCCTQISADVQGIIPQKSTQRKPCVCLSLHLFVQVSAASTFDTICNALNILVGVGLLTVPYALATSGWASLFLMGSVGARQHICCDLICRSSNLTSS